MTDEELDDYVKALVDKAPPLSDAQKSKLRLIFAGARRAA